jgi:carboxymethylenebutenolidase
MCHDSDSRPPPPPIAGGAGTGNMVVLTASDGTPFGAFSAVGGEPRAPGVVILPDVRGLHPFYEELATMFGEAGIHATAIDYFGRTAGVGGRSDGFDYGPHVARTTPETVALDVAAAVAHVRSAAGGGAASVFTVGFCFGGRASFNQAARGHGLAGVIGFYGRVAPRDPNDDDAPVLLASAYECPVLGLFGGADPSITREDVSGFREALDAAGVRNELVEYDEAPHSFFDRAFDQHKAACEDAWTRVLSFIHANAVTS